MKILKNILEFSFGLIIGGIIFFMFTFTSGLDQYTKFHFLVILLIFIIVIILALGIHEMAHFISFLINGLKMGGLIILCFNFIKIDQKWKFKISFLSILIALGLAIPDFDYIKDEAHFKKVRKAYAKGIMMGPISTVGFWLVNTMVFIVGYYFINNVIINSIIFYSFLANSIISFIIISSSAAKGQIVGDFTNYKLIKNDDFFAASNIYLSYTSSSNPQYVKDHNHYLREMIVVELEKKYNDKLIDERVLNIIEVYITDYISGYFDSLPPSIYSYIDYILENNILKDKKYQLLVLLRFRIIQLLYLNNNETKANELMIEIKDEFKSKNPVVNYLIKQTEHILHIEEHTEFLSNNDNIMITAGVFTFYPGFYIDEVRLNKNIIKIINNPNK